MTNSISKLNSTQLLIALAMLLGTIAFVVLIMLVSAYNANELLTERSNAITSELADFCKDQPHGVILSGGLTVVCSSADANGNPINLHLRTEQE
jgi:hypothetical protein